MTDEQRYHSVHAPRSRRRVLFVAEALTLAQVVRLVSLSRALDPERYEVFFACGAFDPIAFEGTALEPISIVTVDRDAAMKRVDRGERLYEKEVLGRYVEEELRLFDSVKPDLVVGDFRLSLPISASHAGIPCASLINAYLSPFAVRDGFPVPDHPIVAVVGHARAARYFPRVVGSVFAHFAAPIDAVRKRYGLPPTGDLLHALCAGDHVLYPDVPELCPTENLPANHHYLGAVTWAPPLDPPACLADLGDRPLVYVTLGSSGRISALKTVLGVLAEFPVLALVSTAGRFDLPYAPNNVRVTRYVRGDEMARRASLVITNGGASTSYQALAEGTPVLGIPSNLDQYLAMTAIERASAGRLVRSGEATETAVRRALVELFESTELRGGARRVAEAFARMDPLARFRDFTESVLAGQKRNDPLEPVQTGSG
jgi:UDP:flavonoid glycosyltransferase YjiC (YdhE family)